jgi:hypothetical protein
MKDFDVLATDDDHHRDKDILFHLRCGLLIAF